MPFNKFRARTLWVGAIVVVLAAVGLLVVASVGSAGDLTCVPEVSTSTSVSGAPSQRLICSPAGDHAALNTTLHTALTNILGALLAIGAVSLIFELSVRRTYSSDLLRFLNLKTSMVKSGVSHVGTARDGDLDVPLATVDDLVFLGRSPATWLYEHLPKLLRIAEKRSLSLTIVLPDPANAALMSAVATGLGTDPQDLAAGITSFRSDLDAKWKASLPAIRSGTAFRLVYCDTAPSFDALAGTSVAAVLLSKPTAAQPGDDLLMVTFDQPKPEFPSAWLLQSLDGFRTANEIWRGDKP